LEAVAVGTPTLVADEVTVEGAGSSMDGVPVWLAPPLPCTLADGVPLWVEGGGVPDWLKSGEFVWLEDDAWV
jgi:uncharacterized protein YfaQ (DUF2300 family)